MVAKTIAKELETVEIVSMAKSKKYTFTKQYDTIGFIFPTYYWGLPRAVMEFISNLDCNNKEAYYYTIATYGGIVGNSISQVKELLNEKNIVLNYGRKLRMVANYIIAYDISKRTDKILQRANNRLIPIILDIKNKKSNKIGKSNTLIKNFHEKSIKNISLIAKDFNVNNNCTGCEICKEICPVKNIEIINKRPVFNDNCEQCIACIQYCPMQAINYKDKTQKRRRYTNPEIDYIELTKY